MWGSPRWDLESGRVPPHRLIVTFLQSVEFSKKNKK